jgi:hypothetical protein
MENNKKNEVAVINRQEFIQKFSPISMLKNFRNVNSLSEAIKAEGNSIAYYRKHMNESTVLALIEAHIVSLNDALNVHEKLKPHQIQEIALEISTLHYHLSPVEIGFVFRKAKRGEYGKINYSLNMPDVMRWFSEYAEERCRHFMQNSEIQSDKDKHSLERVEMSCETKKMLQELKENLSADEKENEQKYQEWKKENGHA